MARKKKYLYICTVEEAEAEREFFRQNPNASMLACSPPGYREMIKKELAAKAAARSPKRKASKRSSR